MDHRNKYLFIWFFYQFFQEKLWSSVEIRLGQPNSGYTSGVLGSFEIHFWPFNNYITLKIEIFALHLPVCVRKHFEHFNPLMPGDSKKVTHT